MKSTNFYFATSSPNFRQGISLDKKNEAILPSGRLSFSEPLQQGLELGQRGEEGMAGGKGGEIDRSPLWILSSLLPGHIPLGKGVHLGRRQWLPGHTEMPWHRPTPVPSVPTTLLPDKRGGSVLAAATCHPEVLAQGFECLPEVLTGRAGRRPLAAQAPTPGCRSKVLVPPACARLSCEVAEFLCYR